MVYATHKRTYKITRIRRRKEGKIRIVEHK